MPRSTDWRRARWSIWASLPVAPARLILSPSASPRQPWCSAPLIRAIRLSRISAMRGRWAGPGQSIGQRMQGLTCPMFATTAEFLPQHHAQRQATLQIITAAEASGHARVAEMNRQVAGNLDKIIASLEDGGEGQEAAAGAS
jgi:hypothetical protein